MNFRTITIILSTIVVALLLIGIPTGLAYDYYVFLRWIVTAIAGYSAYRSFETDNQGWGWIMIIVALVFNPIIPIYLSKSTWVIIDITTAFLFISSMFVLKEK